MDKRADIKPVSFIGKSEIAQRADTLEARAEAKKEAEAQAETIKIVWATSGQYPDGTSWERDATPEEQAEFNNYCR